MICLQQCQNCGAVQYPRRDVCRNCLSDDLRLAEIADRARLLSIATVHRGLASEFDERLPLRIGSVLLDRGVRVISFVEPGLQAGDAVQIIQTHDAAGRSLFTAVQA